METKKECKVVLVKSSRKTNIWLDNFGSGLYHNSTNATGVIYYNMYILSDEEIKPDDWFITIGDIKGKLSYNFSSIHQCVKKEEYKILDGHSIREKLFIDNEYGHYSGYNPNGDESFKKIIATTDCLKVNEYVFEGHLCAKFVPAPSPQFIDKYVESYNKGNRIDKVLVTYTEVDENYSHLKSMCETGDFLKTIVKVDKRNYITINKIQEEIKYTHADVCELIHQLSKDLSEGKYILDASEKCVTFLSNAWITDNLKF